LVQAIKENCKRKREGRNGCVSGKRENLKLFKYSFDVTLNIGIVVRLKITLQNMPQYSTVYAP
jgi:hypothetical protein